MRILCQCECVLRNACVCYVRIEIICIQKTKKITVTNTLKIRTRQLVSQFSPVNPEGHAQTPLYFLY